MTATTTRTRIRPDSLRRLVLVGAAVAGVAMMAGGTVLGGNGGQLAAVRAATDRYHDIRVAKADEFVEFYICTDENTGAGAMGQHYANLGRVGNPALNELEPEVLVYAPMPGGGYRLVGVEYVVLAEAWHETHADPPVLFGDRALKLIPAGNRYGLPDFYELHAWVWRPNPRGVFDDWNSKVSCLGNGDPA